MALGTATWRCQGHRCFGAEMRSALLRLCSLALVLFPEWAGLPPHSQAAQVLGRGRLDPPGDLRARALWPLYP